MIRRDWQKTLIAMARSNGLKSFMQSARTTSFIRRKYVAGPGPSEGAAHAQQLLELSGIRSSLFFMGEYIEDDGLIEETVLKKQEVAQKLALQGLDIHISVDPTQIGH